MKSKKNPNSSLIIGCRTMNRWEREPNYNKIDAKVNSIVIYVYFIVFFASRDHVDSDS